MRSILAVGLDGGLLQTRVSVLKRTSADVTHAYPSEAASLLEGACFDVVILCHTLSVEDSIRMTRIAHQTARASAAETFVLQIVTGALWSPNYDGVPVDGLCESDPGRLVARVNELLRDIGSSNPLPC